MKQFVQEPGGMIGGIHWWLVRQVAIPLRLPTLTQPSGNGLIFSKFRQSHVSRTLTKGYEIYIPSIRFRSYFDVALTQPANFPQHSEPRTTSRLPPSLPSTHSHHGSVR